MRRAASEVTAWPVTLMFAWPYVARWRRPTIVSPRVAPAKVTMTETAAAPTPQNAAREFPEGFHAPEGDGGLDVRRP